MFKFNNNHIFTGYLKQLLASFNLPKCRVYTKEQAEYIKNYPSRIAQKTDNDNRCLLEIERLNSWLESHLAWNTPIIESITQELTSLQEEILALQLTTLNKKEKKEYSNLLKKLEEIEATLKSPLKQPVINQSPEATALDSPNVAQLQFLRTETLRQIEALIQYGELKLDETAAQQLQAMREIENSYCAELNHIATQEKQLKTKIAQLQQEMQKVVVNQELNVIPTIYHSEYFTYPDAIPDDLVLKLEYQSNIRYMPYIKDGRLQVFTDGAWHDCHINFDIAHNNFHKATKNPYTQINYSYGQKILNYTKNLQIQNTIYDSYTHEYLGDYLRFHRDFANINLMPLYNCFSNRSCPHLDITFNLQNGYEVKFKTDQSFETTLYKYYMVPVKFFKNYTIAIDSEASIEVCCCVYDEYQNKDADFADIPKLTYQCFGDMQFKKPVLYTKLQNLNHLLLDPTVNENDVSQQEDNLKLILKVPVNNNSSIVILEGDYTAYNDVAFNLNADNSVTDLEKQILLGKDLIDKQQRPWLKNVPEILATLNTKKTAATKVVKQTNKTVINYEDLTACDFLADKLITPLQLLRANTGESYPFADRLIEYLVGNAITVNEEIQDNVVRAKKIISANCNPIIKSIDAEDGIWEPILQCLTYDYINNTPVTNVYDINHDILGFIDKDVEKWYATGSKTNPKTISNIDIYED